MVHLPGADRGWVQGEMPPTAKQYMEAVAARLLIRNLHLALPSLLPRLTNYVHRHALICVEPACRSPKQPSYVLWRLQRFHGFRLLHMEKSGNFALHGACLHAAVPSRPGLWRPRWCLVAQDPHASFIVTPGACLSSGHTHVDLADLCRWEGLPSAVLVAGHVMLACPPGQQDDVIPPLLRAMLPWTLSHYHALRCSRSPGA